MIKKPCNLKRSRFGYSHLDPVPSSQYLNVFYKELYVFQLRKDIARRSSMSKLLQRDGAAKRREVRWLEQTYFGDRMHFFRQFFSQSRRRKRLLDVGCGVGEFLDFLAPNHEWDCTGIEPSQKFFEHARKKCRAVFCTTLKEYGADSANHNKFDVIVFANAMEHVPDPLGTLRLLHSLLRPGGILYIEVPNDFSVLQNLAQRVTKQKRWWVSSPDHINYFNFSSLERLFKHSKFRVLWRTTDFPMELFILMGDNYIDIPAVGPLCHERRVKLELSLPDELRRDIYHSFAERNLGRVCIMYAQKI